MSEPQIATETDINPKEAAILLEGLSLLWVSTNNKLSVPTAQPVKQDVVSKKLEIEHLEKRLRKLL